MNVHRTLGPGFLESVYQNALVLELQGANLTCETQTPLEVHYRERVVGNFLADLVVEGCVILELKAVMALNQAHEVQLVNYLTATGIENGLLLNFGAKSLGVKRKFRTYGSPNRINPVNLVNPVQKSSPHAFTILELLVAMAVFSLLIVMLMGMVDSASKLWRENENRVDSYREARAAMSIISHDLRNALAGTNLNYIRINNDAYGFLTNAETDTNSAAAIFFLSAQSATSQDPAANKSDVCQVGYFLAYDKTSALAGVNTNVPKTMNLYRYFLSSDETFAKLTNGTYPVFGSSIGALDDDVELLARNITRFHIDALDTNGTSYVSTTNAPLPPVIQIEMTAINTETAKKLDSKSDWIAPTGGLAKVTAKNEQTFSTRVGTPKSQ